MKKVLGNGCGKRRGVASANVLTVVVCGALVVSLLAGCGSATEDSQSADAQPSEVAAAPAEEETGTAESAVGLDGSAGLDAADDAADGIVPPEDADEEPDGSVAESDDPMTVVGFNGSGEAQEAVVVDGTVEVREESGDDGVAYKMYVLSLDEPTRFAMGSFGAGAHERDAVADEVVLGREASDRAAYIDLIWGDLVGQAMSAKGELKVSGDEVELVGAIPADMSRLARQVGVQPRLWGVYGDTEHLKEGYTWRELERIADVIAMSEDSYTAHMIADAYGISEASHGAKPIMLIDGSVYDMQLTGILVSVGESETGEREYAGMEFKEADNPDGMTITLGGAGQGLPGMSE